MPIELYLTSASGAGPARFITVVSHRGFDARWLPEAERLGLAWVPMMRNGFDLQIDNIPEIRRELDRLRSSIRSATPPGLSSAQAAATVGEIDQLSEELERLRTSPDLGAYLG